MSEAPRKRHKWGKEPERISRTTIRTCTVCGLMRFDDNDVWPNAVYWRDCDGNYAKPMPQCEEA